VLIGLRFWLKSLISSWWSAFRIAFSAIYWPASVWLERNFAFFSTVSAGCLVHLFVTVWHFVFHFLLHFFANLFARKPKAELTIKSIHCRTLSRSFAPCIVTVALGFWPVLNLFGPLLMMPFAFFDSNKHPLVFLVNAAANQSFSRQNHASLNCAPTQ